MYNHNMLKKYRLLVYTLFLFMILTFISYFTIGSLNFINLFFRYHISTQLDGQPRLKGTPSFTVDSIFNTDRKIYNSGMSLQFTLTKPDGTKFYTNSVLNYKDDKQINTPCAYHPDIICPESRTPSGDWQTGNYFSFDTTYDQEGFYTVKSNPFLVESLILLIKK